MILFGKPVTIRQAIRIAMIMTDVTGYELADKAHLHYLTISKYSNSKNPETGKLMLSTVELILKGLDVESADFWDLVGDQSELEDTSRRIANLKGTGRGRKK